MQPNNPYQAPVPPQQSRPQPPVPPQVPPAPSQQWGPRPVQPPIQPTAQPQPWTQPTMYGDATPPPLMPPPLDAPSAQPSRSGSLAFTLPMWARGHWLLIIASTLGLIVVLVLVFQLVYPSSWLLPGTRVDGVLVGGMRKHDASAKLDKIYDGLKLAIYFGNNQAAFQAPTAGEVGIKTDNGGRLDALQYPWYLRIVPSSILWAGNLTKAGQPDFTYDHSKIDSYTQGKVGDSCTIPPRDASLKLVGNQLQLVPSVPGGTCDITKFQQALASATPSVNSDNKLQIDIAETPAMVDDDKAKVLADALNNRMATPMPIVVASEKQTIEGGSVLGWLDFKSFVPTLPEGQNNPDKVRDGSKLNFVVNRDRMSDYMKNDISSKVAVPAGVTKIATTDFVETSHVIGMSGKELDPEKTATEIETYLNNKLNSTTAETRPLAPKIVYTRTYTPTSNGFAALLAQYPQEHAGSYAMTYTEIGGILPFRSASYRGSTPMITYGMENGYVGYAVLMGLKDASILTSDKIVDNRLTNQCFNDMIEKTDLSCSNAFMDKIGHETLVARGKELGLTGTIFAQTNTQTTTNDLNYFMVNLFRTQVAPSAGGQRILTEMQATRMSDGIKAGLPSTVNLANLAGEGGTVHNDGAIIYSPKGIYLLSILSDGASRADLANLAKAVDNLHNQQPAKK